MRLVSLVTIIFACGLCSAISALPAEKFQPLQDTLNRYGIHDLPSAKDHPGIPAIGILSAEEYRQLGKTHIRINHRIVKILDAAGKKYTVVKARCYSECLVEGRTIKPDGKIINLPSRDMIRNRQMTEYSAPFSYVQFAMPGVEPGDIVEFRSTVLVPGPFFLEDYLFSESYPVMHAYLVLSHPLDYSYSYTKRGPGQDNVRVTSRNVPMQGQQFVETVFAAKNVPAFVKESFSANTAQTYPGVRLIMDGRSGSKFTIFKDWFEYGKFLSDQVRVEVLPPRSIVDFVKNAAGYDQAAADIVRHIYQAADRKIRLSEDTLEDTGFEFVQPEDVLKNETAAPHDFALFLAACFRHLRWTADLVLVNSVNRTDASRERAFPLDLDMVFLNVITPEGEFLLDCNNNGLPPGILSSAAMNRFALGIPVATGTSSRTVSPYLTTMPYRGGSSNHLTLNLKPEGDSWTSDFVWLLTGEFQKAPVVSFRKYGDSGFPEHANLLLRSRLNADEIRDVKWRWLTTGLEFTGKARFPRRKIAPGIELLQNDFWKSGFHIGQYLLENRANALLLPEGGEIALTVNLQPEPGMITELPPARNLDAGPLRYSLKADQSKQQITIQEKITIQNVLVRPAEFASFGSFLSSYYSHHMWTLLFTSNSPIATGALK